MLRLITLTKLEELKMCNIVNVVAIVPCCHCGKPCCDDRTRKYNYCLDCLANGGVADNCTEDVQYTEDTLP